VKTVRAGDCRIWLVGTDAEIAEAAEAFGRIDFVGQIDIVPEHDEPTGHALAELLAEVNPL